MYMAIDKDCTTSDVTLTAKDVTYTANSEWPPMLPRTKSFNKGGCVRDDNGGLSDDNGRVNNVNGQLSDIKNQSYLHSQFPVAV